MCRTNSYRGTSRRCYRESKTSAPRPVRGTSVPLRKRGSASAPIFRTGVTVRGPDAEGGPPTGALLRFLPLPGSILNFASGPSLLVLPSYPSDSEAGGAVSENL